MEERYEIKSKIGQGGFGSVYRAFDKRMSRDVAIKRISTTNEDGMLHEAARQLSKEAGALASLQHPNIITVYDVGSDEDGPYVVMELLSGNSLDELIERAPLTWDDFRELALQTQEAMIAAQELELVHRDIKPANVMLSWLPSGKFQVKLVDFGLAKLTQRPSLQTLNQADSIFGSIFFMSPEQFERKPLDQRTDMYAMGCVYYYALTGLHPFDGATAVEVMSAHLHHDFVPLNDARPDLPRWVCDWVMWHMNRYPDDRPVSAREALQVFVQNDRNPPVDTPVTPVAAQGGRPRLLIPGAEPLVPGEVAERRPSPPTGELNPKTKTAPQPLIPPTGSKPSIHTSQLRMDGNSTVSPTGQVAADEASAAVESAPVAAPSPAPEEVAAPEPVAEPVADAKPSVQSKPLVPPARAEPPVNPEQAEPPVEPESAAKPDPKNRSFEMKRPAVGAPFAGLKAQKAPETSSQPVAGMAGVPMKVASPGGKPSVMTPATAAADSAVKTPATQAGVAVVAVDAQAAPVRQGPRISNALKMAIAAVLTIFVVLGAFMVMQKSSKNRQSELYHKLVMLGAHPETTEVPMTKEGLEIMLREAIDLQENEKRGAVYRTLLLATSTDNTDIDAEIVKFVTERQMMESVREVLITQVLARRANPSIVGPMLDFASKTSNETAAIAATRAVRSLVTEAHFDRLLNTVQFTDKIEMRRVSEEAIGEIINATSNAKKFAPKLHGIYQTAVNDDARQAAMRLFGRIGDDRSLEIVRGVMKDGSAKDQGAALTALAAWGNDKGFAVLIEFFNTTKDMALRGRAFDAALRYAVSLEERQADETLRKDVWTQLALNAREVDEQERVVRGVAINDTDDWVIPLLQGFTRNSNKDRVIDVAEQAIRSIQDRRRRRAEASN